ncbi:MAG: type II CAAX endopeptidase family protein [Gammaproteobacteria bacterium]|nr:type II CAAX endopeptidase family protein [Gammaproteobacteria bacterium]
METIKKIFFNASGKLRNGWWVLAFIAVYFVIGFSYRFGMNLLGEDVLPRDLGLAIGIGLILLATWIVMRLRKERLSDVGLVMNSRWARDFFIGTGLGIAMILVTATLVMAFAGVRFAMNPEASVTTMLYGLYFFLIVSLREELLFRGFIFQRAIDGLGPWGAQVLFGLFFAVAHFGNPGMEGVTFVVATIVIALAAIFLGAAYIKTRSLALPIGIHLGWNWAQGYVLGFGVSGTEVDGILEPSFGDAPVWLSGGNFGVEASVFAIAVVIGLTVLVWKWKLLEPAAAR